MARGTADTGLEAAIDEAQEALRTADLDGDSQLRVVEALEKVVAAYEEAGTDEEDFAAVRESLEERREKLVEVARRSLEAADSSDDEAEVQGVLAGSHRILHRLEPKRAGEVERRAGELGQKPFFSRFLQDQTGTDRPITLKFPSDKEDTPSDRRCLDVVTRKFPSDWEDRTGAEPGGERPEWVTLKFPSDDDEIVTLKFPSDSDEPVYR